MTKTPRDEAAYSIARIERSIGRKLTDEQKRMVLVVRAIAPFYRLPTLLNGEGTDVWRFDNVGLTIDLVQELATTDGPELTKLVIAAHQQCVRLALYPKIRVVKNPEAECDDGCVCDCEARGDGWCDCEDCSCQQDHVTPVIEMRLTPRDPESRSLMTGHPSPADLSMKTTQPQFGR